MTITQSNKKILIVISIILIAVIGAVGYLLWPKNQSTANNSNTSSSSSSLSSSSVGGSIRNQSSATNNSSADTSGETVISKAELAAANGLNGTKCYVAVFGTVYDMTNFNLWQGGTHTTSRGEANCGEDNSDVIAKAPHGISKLSSMPKVGKLGN